MLVGEKTPAWTTDPHLAAEVVGRVGLVTLQVRLRHLHPHLRLLSVRICLHVTDTRVFMFDVISMFSCSGSCSVVRSCFFVLLGKQRAKYGTHLNKVYSKKETRPFDRGDISMREASEVCPTHAAEQLAGAAYLLDM